MDSLPGKDNKKARNAKSREIAELKKVRTPAVQLTVASRDSSRRVAFHLSLVWGRIFILTV